MQYYARSVRRVLTVVPLLVIAPSVLQGNLTAAREEPAAHLALPGTTALQAPPLADLVQLGIISPAPERPAVFLVLVGTTAVTVPLPAAPLNVPSAITVTQPQ